MYTEIIGTFWPSLIFTAILFIIGLYCIFFTYNLIRVLIGAEILIKAVTLLIITVGYVTYHTALAQAIVITLIVIEAVVMTVAVGIVLGIYRKTNSLDVRKIRNLRG